MFGLFLSSYLIDTYLFITFEANRVLKIYEAKMHLNFSVLNIVHQEYKVPSYLYTYRDFLLEEALAMLEAEDELSQTVDGIIMTPSTNACGH